jgi:tRNA nucleotidyltransferase (CCA-adding enzyme)
MKTSIPAPEPPLRALAERADLTVRDRQRVRRLVATRLAPAQREALGRLAAAADAAGQSIYLVGGAVRDLLQRLPLRDLDVAVEGDARALAERAGGARRTHASFGTATVQFAPGVRLDLATTRTEHYRQPAALPEVRRAGLAEDLARRDFTINALAVPWNRDGPLGLIDPFGGSRDLRARRVRVLHARSFLDDPTRLFRAVRLAAGLDFRIEPVTARWMRAGGAGIERLSAARLRHEVERTLGSDHADRAVRLLAAFALLPRIAREWRAPPRAPRQVARLQGLLCWWRRRTPGEEVSAWTIVLALLLRESSEARIREVLGRLQPDRGARAAVLDGLAALRGLPRALAGALPPSRIHAACRPHTTEALLAVLASSPPSGRTARRVRRFLGALRDVRADVDGSDLLRAGVFPGPAVARGLRAALAAKLDGRAPGRAGQLRAALDAARSS